MSRRRPHRIGALAGAAAALALAPAACGGSSGDLMSIDVSGGAARRSQRIVVQDNGQATCNGGPLTDIGSSALIEARDLERELKDPAEDARTFPSATPGAAGATYVARTNDGTVRWQETARGLPPVLPRVVLFALQQGRKLC